MPLKSIKERALGRSKPAIGGGGSNAPWEAQGLELWEETLITSDASKSATDMPPSPTPPLLAKESALSVPVSSPAGTGVHRGQNQGGVSDIQKTLLLPPGPKFPPTCVTNKNMKI